MKQTKETKVMKNTSKITTGIILIGMTLQSEAALIKADLSPGDRQLTFDSDTGLSWLNSPNTYGLSYNAVMAEFAGSGFRYATAELPVVFDAQKLRKCFCFN